MHRIGLNKNSTVASMFHVKYTQGKHVPLKEHLRNLKKKLKLIYLK
jgi:hypothetical protein